MSGTTLLLLLLLIHLAEAGQRLRTHFLLVLLTLHKQRRIFEKSLRKPARRLLDITPSLQVTVCEDYAIALLECTLLTLLSVSLHYHFGNLDDLLLLNCAVIVAHKDYNRLPICCVLQDASVPVCESTHLDDASHIVEDNEGFFLTETTARLSIKAMVCVLEFTLKLDLLIELQFYIEQVDELNPLEPLHAAR